MINKVNSKEIDNPIQKLLNSIDNLLYEEKEQKLRSKLGKEIKKSIFTDEIMTKLNASDFSGLVESEEEMTTLFSMIFPVFVEIDGVTFRLYKHKIEVDLSDEMRDRYIYIFSDGRLTSGLFQCFRLYDAEYVYGIKRIIKAIPVLKQTIGESLLDLEKAENLNKVKIEKFKSNEQISEKNYNELMKLLK